MGDEEIARNIESVSKQIDAEVAAIAINDELAAAVRKLDEEEAQLKQQFANREISKNEYFTLWNELMDRTPHEVMLASIKLTQAIVAALSKPRDTTEA